MFNLITYLENIFKTEPITEYAVDTCFSAKEVIANCNGRKSEGWTWVSTNTCKFGNKSYYKVRWERTVNW